MLRIRAEQLAEMSERRMMDFKDRLEIALLGATAKEQASAAARWAASSCIDEGILAGRRYKLVRECDLARFILLVWQHLGGRFGDLESPPTTAILLDHRFGPEDKLERLERWAAAQSGTRTRMGGAQSAPSGDGTDASALSHGVKQERRST
ncbi:MAG: hypothetical protein IPJ27_05530 [Candidatus Accumulibacter sp.]|uniref:Uncharacterized protein n=1 Tax=Candidatus Accumulibacter proximus TaxID=2954385 RepID=A0A935UGB0_9PROT|nr:hypothetical protein [Candidatus Accumulibacter proximus]